jgi:hypothetical protein
VNCRLLSPLEGNASPSQQTAQCTAGGRTSDDEDACVRATAHPSRSSFHGAELPRQQAYCRTEKEKGPAAVPWPEVAGQRVICPYGRVLKMVCMMR